MRQGVPGCACQRTIRRPHMVLIMVSPSTLAPKTPATSGPRASGGTRAARVYLSRALPRFGPYRWNVAAGWLERVPRSTEHAEETVGGGFREAAGTNWGQVAQGLKERQ